MMKGKVIFGKLKVTLIYLKKKCYSLIIYNLETAVQPGKPKELTHQMRHIRLCMTGYRDDIK